jgi:hypothetical protein
MARTKYTHGTHGHLGRERIRDTAQGGRGGGRLGGQGLGGRGPVEVPRDVRAAANAPPVRAPAFATTAVDSVDMPVAMQVIAAAVVKRRRIIVVAAASSEQTQESGPQGPKTAWTRFDWEAFVSATPPRVHRPAHEKDRTHLTLFRFRRMFRIDLAGFQDLVEILRPLISKNAAKAAGNSGPIQGHTRAIGGEFDGATSI